MPPHSNFFRVKADNNYQLGLKLGEIFRKDLAQTLEEKSQEKFWNEKVDRAKLFSQITAKYFPNFLEELKGYAKGVGTTFDEIWALSMEADLTLEDHCTAVITNSGLLIGHNEDWDESGKENISVLEKTIGDLTILELYYHHTLGGCSISINSNGFIHGVNSLSHTNTQIGVPRNVIARFLSETNDPDKDIAKLDSIPRQFGYNHYLVSKNGEIWNLETTDKEKILVKPQTPFVHTNHYLTDLKRFEENDNSTGTRDRYDSAKTKAQAKMSPEELNQLMSDKSNGDQKSIFNQRTIGRMIVDLENHLAKIWLLRENNKGFIDYQLNFIEK